MAGFLDSESQIIDMVLTGHGKKLLSHGQLRFVYWAAYDDEIQYSSPCDQTGTALLSGSQLVAQIESPLQREATIGYRNFNLRGEDFTNVNRALVTVPPGQAVVPSATFVVANEGLSFQQQPVVQVGPDGSETNMGVIRANSTQIHAYGDYTKDSYPRGHKMDGFYVRILASGTNGYIEQHHTLDDDSRIVVGAQLRVDVDSPGDE